MRLIDADAIKFHYGGLGNIPYDDFVGTANYFMDQIKEMPTVNPEPQWIPCSERPPEEEGFYLVTLEHEYGAETNIRFFKYENGELYWSKWGNENITAWMPKPEPYKGVTE